MQIFNRFFITFLIVGFFSLNGMEEEDTSNQSSAKAEVHENEPKVDEIFKTELKGSLSLKALIALEFLELINAGKLSWKDLSERLPEGSTRYIELFHIANTYFNHSSLEPQRALFYELISSGSKDLELFVTALDDLFECLSTENLDEDSHHFIPLLQIMIDKQYLIMRDQNTNFAGIERRYRKNQAKLLFSINSLDDFFFKKIRYKNLICLINLFLELNLVTSKGKVQLFCGALKNSDFPIQLLKLLVEKMNLTKKELQEVLTDKIELMRGPLHDILHNIMIDCIESDMSGLKIKYIFELIEKHGIDVKKIISKQYTMRVTKSKLGTLLQIAIVQINIKAVEFLLNKQIEQFGIDEQVAHVLDFARAYLEKFQQDEGFIKNANWFHSLAEMNLIIKILEEAINSK